MYNATLKPIGQFFHAIASSPGRIDRMETKLDLIIGELKPNGGTSLKDQLNRLEESVSVSQAQRKLILDSSSVGVWTSDADGMCTWVNETLRKRVRADSIGTFLGENWINVIHVADRKFVMEEWQSAVENQRDFDLHYRMINIETQMPFNVHVKSSPAKCFRDKVIGYNGTVYFL
jgi:two-component system CheB/CheR fusion protein